MAGAMLGALGFRILYQRVSWHSAISATHTGNERKDYEVVSLGSMHITTYNTHDPSPTL